MAAPLGQIAQTMSRMDRLFLLVFHGGLVGYLLLHNVLIPVTRNWGQGLFLLDSLQYYFLPQLMLWIAFAKNYKVSWALGFNVGISIVALAQLLFSLSDGISTHEFSTAISLAAMAFFFLGFSLYFKKFFFPPGYTHLLMATLVGVAVMGVSYGLGGPGTQHTAHAPILRETRSPPAATTTLKLPSQNYSQGPIAILTHGFEHPYGLYPNGSSLAIVNKSPRRHLIRVEYIKNHRWYFKRIVPIAPKEQKSLALHGRGIYRLRSPSSKELGLFIAVTGSELFDPGAYRIDAKGLEVIE